MDKNKVTYGLEQVHIAIKTSEGVYGTPIKVPGAVSFTPSADGSQTVFHADNIAYFVMNANNGYTADLTVALIPDELLMQLLGWEKDDDGAIVEIANARTKSFALSFQVEGDAQNRRMTYFECVADRPAKEHSTNTDTVEIVPDILSLKISPIDHNGKKIVKSQIELSAANKVAYDAWFTDVTLPTFTVEP